MYSSIIQRGRRLGLGVGIPLSILCSLSFMFWLGGDGLTPTQENHGRKLSIEEIQ